MKPKIIYLAFTLVILNLCPSLTLNIKNFSKVNWIEYYSKVRKRHRHFVLNTYIEKGRTLNDSNFN